MRILIAVSLAAGCVFTPGEKEPVGDPGNGSGSGTVAAKCHVSDSQLRLCLDFEDALSPTTADLSGLKHDATVTGIQPMARGGQQAAELSQTSSIVVPETADLDIPTTLTIEMWLSPASLPTATAYLLQNDHQYSLALAKDGRIKCAAGGASVDTAPGPLQPGWSHVACTYDGATLRLYRDGDIVKCVDTNNPTPTPTTGTVLGTKYVGGIDDVHVYARALSDADVCARAGQLVCIAGCASSSHG